MTDLECLERLLTEFMSKEDKMRVLVPQTHDERRAFAKIKLSYTTRIRLAKARELL